MDRKCCVLLYSNHSKASLDVLNYIKNIPIDFLTITGMTMICIDNPEFKLILHNNGITHVPTLLVEYYNGSKQKFERDYIYMWIDQIITRNLGRSEPDPTQPSTPQRLGDPSGMDRTAFPTKGGRVNISNEQNTLPIDSSLGQTGSESAVQTNRTPIYHIDHTASFPAATLPLRGAELRDPSHPSSQGPTSSHPSSQGSNAKDRPLDRGGATLRAQAGRQPQDPTQVQLKTTPNATIPMNLNKKPDIAAIALEMQKNRDIELAEIKEYQKPI